MKYQVIARKFRPQTFEEVVGQNPIVQTLKNAIDLDRIGHAYLFCGPRGVGKTTTARLLAKALNCSQGPTATPCNECASCQEISAGRSIDVLEIDAASNTGVDNIRELRENARYAPSRDRFKIFIVDEVHMLSTSAFNALLKILEEPPEHITFILATTERHKLPPTILSRCQQFVFRTIPPAETLEHLRQIAEKEGVRLGEGALDYVVKAADGSMRDAQSLLDQIIAFGGQEISDADVRDVLGFIPSELLDRAVEGLIERNSRALLDVVEVVANHGLNLQQFVRELVARVRDMLLAKLGITERILADPEERAQIESHAERFSETDLIRFLDMLISLENDLRVTSEPRFHLELGCIKLSKIGQLREIEDVIRDLNQGGSSPRPMSSAETRHPTSTLPKQGTTASPPPPPPPTPVPERPETQTEQKPPAVEKPSKPPDEPDRAAVQPHTEPPEQLPFKENYRNAVAARSPATGLYLDQTGAIRQNQDFVRIEVSNPALQATLKTPPHLRVLEETAAELLGRPVSVSLSLIMTAAPEDAVGSPPNHSLTESAGKETLVQNFIDVFRGQIAQVKSAQKPNAK